MMNDPAISGTEMQRPRDTAPRQSADDSLMGETHRLPAIICACGFFLRLIFNDAVMQTLGMADSVSNAAGSTQKLHPGIYLIWLSFFLLLANKKSPLRAMAQIIRECSTYSLLLLFYLCFFIYWLLRDPSGASMLIDTHMTAPLCAIVFSYAPRSYCRRIITLFLMFMTVNSIAGIAESAGKFRLLTFKADWQEELLFRASAFLGHPLDNALYTSLALFVMLNTPLPALLKGLLLVLFMTALIAFGERTALGISVAGLIPLGILAIRRAISDRRLTLTQIFLLIAAALVIPFALAGGLYMLINSNLGERIASLFNIQDESANARWVAFRALDYMSMAEIMLGISLDRMLQIVDRLSIIQPMADIENPWLLMLMYMGAVFFTFWLCLLIAYIVKLMRGSSWALKAMIVAYFLIASTSNSFGTKGGSFAALATLVVCAGSAFTLPRKDTPANAVYPANHAA